MATTIKLEGEARSEFGKGVARRLRVANKIPATIYAGGEEPAFVTLPMRETTLALRHTNALFTIACDDGTGIVFLSSPQSNADGTTTIAAYGYLNENGEVTERFGQILLDGGKYKYQAQ